MTHLNLTLKAINVSKNLQITRVTHNIELATLVSKYLAYMISCEETKVAIERKKSWDELIHCVCGAALNLTQVSVKKVRITVYKTISKDYYLSSKAPVFYTP